MGKFAKATLPVVAGVMVAGWLMYALRDVALIDTARRGYDV